MKITNEFQTKAEPKFTRQVNETKGFQTTLQSQIKHVEEQQLKQLMKNITVQGEKLAKSRNFRDLARFKRMIKEFLQVTVSNGFNLEKKHSFSMYGSRNLTIVKEIDEKLLELTEQVMGEEKKTVHILGLIGEIKGLLINLYT